MNSGNLKIMVESEFCPIPNFKNYLINRKGDIFSLKRRKILKARKGKFGYLYIGITNDNGNRKFIKIHRAVALTFIPQTDGKPFINHKDGNKLNNDVSNLEWCTAKENVAHAIAIGLSNPQVKQMQTREAREKSIQKHSKPILQKTIDGDFVNIFKNSVEAMKSLFGNNAKNQCGKIRDCANGLTQTAYGFIWEKL